MAGSLAGWIFTEHARSEMARRGIDATCVEAVLANPEQRFEARINRDVLQSRVVMDQVEYLIRVFVDVDRMLEEVVTVYRSSKITKYWRVSV